MRRSRRPGNRSALWSCQCGHCGLRSFYGSNVSRVADEILARPEVDDLVFGHEEVQIGIVKSELLEELDQESRALRWHPSAY